MLSFRCAAARRAFGRFCLLGRAAFGTCNLRSGSTTLNNSVLSDNDKVQAHAVGSHFLYVLPTTSYENASATCTMEQLTPLFSLRFLCIETQPKTTIQFSRTMTNASKCDDHRDSGRQSDSRSEFVHFVAL